nr:hypothetical protein [Tanacetum cinerariifolium]
SKPLFDLDGEIISSEFNPIHNEDLDSTPKNDRFDTKSYLLESLLNRDTLMASSPKFDSPLEEFSGELSHTDLIPSGINEANCDPEEDIHLQYLDKINSLINSEYCNEIKINELKENFNGMNNEINKKKKLQQLEQVANLSTYPSQHFNSFCYNDDDDDEDYTIAITPDFSIMGSLSMGDEHLSTILETESDEFIKSSVEILIQNPSVSEDECECDVPDYDDSQTINFSTFSNPLFDDSTSIDDESILEEAVNLVDIQRRRQQWHVACHPSLCYVHGMLHERLHILVPYSQHYLFTSKPRPSSVFWPEKLLPRRVVEPRASLGLF